MTASRTRQGPAATGPESHNVNHHAANHSALRPIDRLLPLLRDVRAVSRDSWRADCPNGHQRLKDSLAITEASDGRILLHCFACNDVRGILAVVGLTSADLFPGRIRDPSPEARASAREAFKRSAWRAALGVLAREATVIACAAGMIRQGQVLSADDDERLAQAIERIHTAREVLSGRT
ncbi:MAG: hypothetical protein JSS44_05455 [Proteobacteria bacterium]|nr:hypothetical protein [Pseudomonadota bacterium]